MTTDLSIISLVMDASGVVKVVLGILVLASVASWVVIIEKQRLFKRVTRDADQFEGEFWSGGDLANLYQDVSQHEPGPWGMANLFHSGFREFGRLRHDSGLPDDQLVEGARRSMRVAEMRELDRLERNLAFLATVSNTSPYIGLFGTVWGIMSAFHALGGVHTATIAMVAPGISEALIATAMGLVAAIPAGIAFNRYADQLSRLEVRFDTFLEELSAIFQRSTPRKEGGEAVA